MQDKKEFGYNKLTKTQVIITIAISIAVLLGIALLAYAQQPLIMHEPLSGQSTDMVIHAVTIDIEGGCILNCIVLPDSSKLQIHLTNEHITILSYASGIKNLLRGQ